MRVGTLMLGAAALALTALAMPTQAAEWTGFRVGVIGSATSTRASFALPNDPADKLQKSSSSKTRFVGGLLVGYDWQFDNKVFGIEANATSNAGTRSATSCSVQFGCFTSAGDSFTTYNRLRTGTTSRLRVRFGFVADDTLYYAAAGFSHMKAHMQLVGNCFNADDPEVPTVYNYERSKGLSGYNVAVGLERSFGERWFARAEYQFEDFGNTTWTTGSPEWSARRISLRSNRLQVAVGLHF